jgi:hypothetical protein
MTVTKGRLSLLGAGLCKIGLYVIALSFLGQVLYDVCYVHSNDSLFYLGIAFALTFALRREFRATARRSASPRFSS